MGLSALERRANREEKKRWATGHNKLGKEEHRRLAIAAAWSFIENCRSRCTIVEVSVAKATALKDS
jgi:hypothetical protein